MWQKSKQQFRKRSKGRARRSEIGNAALAEVLSRYRRVTGVLRAGYARVEGGLRASYERPPWRRLHLVLNIAGSLIKF